MLKTAAQFVWRRGLERPQSQKRDGNPNDFPIFSGGHAFGGPGRLDAIDRQNDLGQGQAAAAQNADSPDLDQAPQGARRSTEQAALGDEDDRPIIGHEVEALRERPRRQVALAASRGSTDQGPAPKSV
jgi:hypothetical protein